MRNLLYDLQRASAGLYKDKRLLALERMQSC